MEPSWYEDEDPMEIKKGDKVQLNSGGPIMSVSSFTFLRGKARCTWFDGQILCDGLFSPEQLEKYSPLRKEVLRNIMLTVRSGAKTPEDAAEDLYRQLFPKEHHGCCFPQG
jgi:uncharacterized protein YodC (DUF2158 family)